MDQELTLAHAEWCRKQAAKYIKIATGIEDLLTETKVREASKNEINLFPDNRPSASFDEVQEECAKGGRVKNVAQRLQITEGQTLFMIKAPNSKYFIGDKGWIRPKGWVDPKKVNA